MAAMAGAKFCASFSEGVYIIVQGMWKLISFAEGSVTTGACGLPPKYEGLARDALHGPLQ